MTAVTPEKATSFLRKKVVGIPVVYLAAGFVLILAVFAWQTKAVSAPASTEAQPENADDTILSEADNPPLPLGSVYAMPANPDDTTDGTGISDNDEWLRKGVMFLANSRGTSPGAAQEALSLYLDGAELSWEQGQMRDNVIRELGMPPYPVNVGSTRPDIARPQGPTPRDHVVKNANDNTATKLAAAYYGRTDAFAVALITKANSGNMNFPIGASVHIPSVPTPSSVKSPAWSAGAVKQTGTR